MKQPRLAIAITLSIFLSACGGSDSSSSANNKSYSGYMPKFSSAYISDSPKAISSHQQSASFSEPTQTKTDIPVEEETTINLTPLDCNKSTEIFNAAPQANNFTNSAIDFIRNFKHKQILMIVSYASRYSIAERS